jgi:heterodisulfide reductase subunit C2
MTFLEIVERDSGTLVRKCYQCGRCSGDCPVSFAMDYLPNQIMRLVQLGRREELLRSKAIWQCSSCLTCSAVCPQELDPAGVIDSLRMMSPKRDRVKVFNETFLQSVKYLGRVHEPALVVGFNVLSGDLFQNMTKAPGMLVKGKLSILPKAIMADARPIFEHFGKGGAE